MKKAIKKLGKSLIGEGNNSIRHAKLSFSQCGEDLIVDYIFKLRGISKPTYLDIGANDPYYLNNTAIFYQRGSKGINVDANPSCISKFLIERPKDTNLNIGIGAQKTESTFYIMKDSTLSTFSEVEFLKYKKSNKSKLIDKKIINIHTLKDVLATYNDSIFPDFLSLDIEGLDYEVIKSIDFKVSSPKVICVEISEYSPTGSGRKKNEIVEFLIDKGYFEYATTNLNSIFVKNSFWLV